MPRAAFLPKRELATVAVVMAALLCAAAPAGAEEFEKAHVVDVAGVIPAGLLRSEVHRIDPRAKLSGTVRKVRIRTDAGAEELEGLPELRQRINEARAIVALSERSVTDAAGTGALEAGKSRWNIVRSIFTRPLTTAGQIGGGLGRLAERTGEGIHGGKSRLEDPGAAGLVGATRRKRLAAAALGVDPYTDNVALEKQLDRIGWSEAAGGTGVGIGAGAILPPGVDSAMTALGLSEQLQRAVVEASPLDLRMQNREKLRLSGIEGETADIVLSHGWISPTVETAVCDALAVLGPRCDRTVLLERTDAVRGVEDAASLARLCGMLAKRAREGRPLVKLFHAEDLIVGIDAMGSVTLFSDWDYALWTKRNAELLRKIIGASQSRCQTRVTLWMSGQGSPAFVSGVGRMDMRLVANVLVE